MRTQISFFAATLVATTISSGCTQHSYVILSAVKDFGVDDQPDWIALDAGNGKARHINARRPIAPLPPGRHHVIHVDIEYETTPERRSRRPSYVSADFSSAYMSEYAETRERIDLRAGNIMFSANPGMITWIGSIHLEEPRDQSGKAPLRLAIRQNDNQIRLACQQSEALFKKYSVRKLLESGTYETLKIDCADYR